MKLVRFGPPGCERPGVWLDRVQGLPGPGLLDVRAMAFDLADYDARFFAHGGIERVRALLEDPRPLVVPAEGQRLGAPIARPGQIIAVGKNYADHAAEMGGPPPPLPMFFGKAVSSLNGPFDLLVLPREARRVDAEAELGVVIGRVTRRVSEEEALASVAGYTIVNDASDRDAQMETSQYFRGKSFDTFCPVGPFLVTPDEVPNPHDLRVTGRLNGQVLQDGHTGQMIFRLGRLISSLSRNLTLQPGDLLATGTPAGIGSARKPPVLLRAGDVVEIAITGLGEQRSPVVAEPS